MAAQDRSPRVCRSSRPVGQALVATIPDGMPPKFAEKSARALLNQQPGARFPTHQEIAIADDNKLVIRGLGHDFDAIRKFDSELQGYWFRAQSRAKYGIVWPGTGLDRLCLRREQRRDRHITLALVVLLAALWAVFGSPFSRGQVSDEMLFRFCYPVPYVRLEVFLQETGASRIMTEESIHNLAEQRLRREGMFFDEQGEHSHLKKYIPSVRLSVLKHEQAFNTQVAFRRQLWGSHKDRSMRVAVWAVENVGMTDEPLQVLTSLSKQLDRFLDEYLFTNSSAECKQNNAQLYSQPD